MRKTVFVVGLICALLGGLAFQGLGLSRSSRSGCFADCAPSSQEASPTYASWDWFMVMKWLGCDLPGAQAANEPFRRHDP